MKSEKKFFLTRTDTVEVATHYIVSAVAHIVVLNIPKDSVLGNVPENFRMLQRETETAGKELIIESVDEHILELAALASINAIHPVFRRRERAVSDIIPRVPVLKKSKEVLPKPVPIVTDMRKISLPPRQPSPKFDLREKTAAPVPAQVVKPTVLPAIKPVEEERRPKEQLSKKPRSRFRLLVISAVVLVCAVALVFAVYVLPRATITLTMKKIPVTFHETIYVDSAASVVNASSAGAITLPGELLVANKNLEMSFPATNKEEVSTKATGVLTVYNAYNAESQTLVATTRFQSPEGKIFRLNNRVTVPGASIVSGKTIPSSIDVEVTADEAGEAYNVSSSTGWKIPGFQGTPRYQGFYAEAKYPMHGGAVGMRSVPGDVDVIAGKKTVREALIGALTSQMLVVRSGLFKLFSGASSSSVVQEIVQSHPADEGTFGIFTEVQMRELIFDEGMLKDALVVKAKQSIIDSEGLEVKNFVFEYSDPVIDLKNGKMKFDVSGSVVLAKGVDIPEFQKEIVGKDEESLKVFVLGLPGLDQINVSLSPFWVSHVPEDTEKVIVTVN